MADENTRRLAAQMLGVKDCPVKVEDHLDECKQIYDRAGGGGPLSPQIVAVICHFVKAMDEIRAGRPKNRIAKAR